MVHQKSITKYVVSYKFDVVIQLNEDLSVIGHSMSGTDEMVECFVLGGEPDTYSEIIELFPNSRPMDDADDYHAIVGNAQSYLNGLTLVFGQGEDNDEPF